MTLWMNWVFKDEEDYHFTEKNLLQSLKNGRFFQETSLKLENEGQKLNNIFLPQKKKQMEKSLYESLETIDFLKTNEKLWKLGYLDEKTLEEVGTDGLEDKDDNLILNIYWRMMNVYKQKNYGDKFANEIPFYERMDEYEKFSSELKYFIHSLSMGISAVLDPSTNSISTCEFDPNEKKKSYLIVQETKILREQDFPTIITRFGEGISKKEVDFVVKSALELKNNFGDNTILIFTDAYKETNDFNEIYFPEKVVKKDFMISKSIDQNNLSLKDVNLNEITSKDGSLSVQEDQLILFHNDLEVIFVSHQRNPLNIPLLISKWKENYPGFSRNYSFCSDFNLLSRLEHFINESSIYATHKEITEINEKEEIEEEKKNMVSSDVEKVYNPSPSQVLKNEKLENEVIQQERKLALPNIFPKEKLSKDYDAHLTSDWSIEKEYSLKEKIFLKKIDQLISKKRFQKEKFVEREQDLLLYQEHLERDVQRWVLKYNSLVSVLVLLINIVVISFFYFYLTSPQI